MTGGVPEQVSKWDLMRIETCGGGKVFLVYPLVYGEYLGIYRAKIRVGEAPEGPQAWERPPTARLQGLSPNGGPSAPPKVPGCLLVQEKSSKSFLPFGLRLVLIFCKRQKQEKTTTGTWH